MERRCQRFHGFTLVELLVVIAVIGVLVALLLPAIQGAREAARRATCISNLKQISLSMLNFETSHSVLPAGYLSNSPSTDSLDPKTWDRAPGWGWGAQLLPFLEEVALGQLIDLHQPIWSTQFAPVIRTNLPTFLCPSVSGVRDPLVIVDAHQQPLLKDGHPIELARAHYVASHGQESCWGTCGASPTAVAFSDIFTSETKVVEVGGDISKIADGPFYRNSQTRMRDVTDGTSKTIFLGEHSSTLSDKTWVGAVPGAMVHPRIDTPENSAEAAATLVLVHGGPAGGELDITGFPIIHPVNFPTLHVGQMFAEHPGGGNIALGDASVRFVAEDIDLLVWAALSSMNEAEPTGAF